MHAVEAAIGRAQTDMATFDAPRAFRAFLHDNPSAAPARAPLDRCAALGLIAPNFVPAFHLSPVIQPVTAIGVLGAAQTLVALTAGADLSIAAIMVLSFMIMARRAVEGGAPAPLAILVGLGAGVACGLLNGARLARLRLLPILAAALVWIAAPQTGLRAAPLGILVGLGVGVWGEGPPLALRRPPFIVTLGAWSIFFALTLWQSEAQTTRSQDIDAAAPRPKPFGLRVELFGAQLTLGSFPMLGVFAALWSALGWTGRGRSVHAVGDDKAAARTLGDPY